MKLSEHPVAMPALARIPALMPMDLPAEPPTPVTQPFMPPLEEFVPFLETIWSNRWLTNSGPFHQQLERALEEYLGVPYISLTSNGTTALWLALQAMKVGGEVITTPFTFVATAHALRLVGATPVFVDIDEDDCNLAPAGIEAAVTDRTSAILPVHCFGHPCDTAAISRIADVYELKVIYDAAHAFGVQIGGQSILRQGDLSVLSFHATKVFNTLEGGAIVSPDQRTKSKIDRLRNFGFIEDTVMARASINGKLNELQSAFGLLQLRYIDGLIARRGEISARYHAALADIDGIAPFSIGGGATLNHSYFPILVSEDYPVDADALCRRLQAAGILARRYFHPLICDMPGYRDLPSARQPLPVARRIARQILCLPIHPNLSDSLVDRTIDILSHG
ncbi:MULTISPECIES: DegT/DnrJ/EryC1/StrS aminotransferase family protein [unclassified Novosphingobium]|uniref:DegT/DnrJ/EryC1/StrS family aminotransferase n=1 Tax=unclassified Novosphingobium TaxID=2644732 RepID=UPI00272A8E6A|nr:MULTISPECIES: DegT/DnrJ/EryC1/StrS family aminotransferase [unclassified Novosphingobium]